MMKHGYPSFDDNSATMTNLKKIKGMGAEEFAEWLENVVLSTAPGPCSICTYYYDLNKKCPGATCVPGMVEWLNSEVDEINDV